MRRVEFFSARRPDGTVKWCLDAIGSEVKGGRVGLAEGDADSHGEAIRSAARDFDMAADISALPGDTDG